MEEKLSATTMASCPLLFFLRGKNSRDSVVPRKTEPAAACSGHCIAEEGEERRMTSWAKNCGSSEQFSASKGLLQKDEPAHGETQNCGHRRRQADIGKGTAIHELVSRSCPLGRAALRWSPL